MRDLESASVALVLCHLDDTLALRVYSRLLRRLGPARTRLVVAEELALARRWEHSVGRERIGSRVELHGGTTIDEASVAVVLNRLRFLPALQFARSSEVDQGYAAAELYALATSWLAGFGCEIANAASATALCGRRWSRHERLHRAAQAGLPVQRCTTVLPPRDGGRILHHKPVASGPPAYVIADRVLGAPAGWEDGCRRLAVEAGAVLLELSIGARRDDSPCVVDIDPLPTAVSPSAFEAMVTWLADRTGGA